MSGKVSTAALRAMLEGALAELDEVEAGALTSPLTFHASRRPHMRQVIDVRCGA